MTFNRFGIIAATFCFWLTATPSHSADLISPSEKSLPETLVIGSISTKPSLSFERLIPLCDYLQVQLSEFGIRHVEIKVARSIEQMQTFIDAGEVDIVSETLLTAIKLKHVDVDLLRWKKGVARYQSLLITQADSDIHSINDLIGKSIALEDSGSTSGYLIPMLAITKLTDQARQKDNIQTDNNPNKINYIFSVEAYSISRANLAVWVHRSIVDAAAISDLDWGNEKKYPQYMKRDLRVFHRFDMIPRSLVMLRSSLEANLKVALTKTLINAHHDPQGKEALQLFVNTKKITLLTNAEKQDIESAREGYNQRLRMVE